MPEAPSSSLLDLIALRLVGSDGNQIGMATLISPSVAITAHPLVENHQEYFLSRPSLSGEGPRSRASVFARDPRVGFAALSLDSPLDERLPHMLLKNALPPLESVWESRFYSPEGFQWVSGQVYSVPGPVGRTPIGLTSAYDKSLFDAYYASMGAPVVITQDWLIGITTAPAKTYWAAIPMVHILESAEWKRVAEAMQSESSSIEPEGDDYSARLAGGTHDFGSEAPPDSASDARTKRRTKRRPPTPKFDRRAFQARLSSSSLMALTHAVGILRSQGQGKIHMEHLIAGLFQKSDGPTRREFTRAGIDREKLAQIIVNDKHRPTVVQRLALHGHESVGQPGD